MKSSLESLLSQEDAVKVEKPAIPVIDEDKEGNKKEKTGRTLYTLGLGREFSWPDAFSWKAMFVLASIVILFLSLQFS